MVAQFTGCSHFSYYGAATVGDIVKKLKELNYSYGTLTEYGNVSSAIEFYEKCKKEKLKPIIGVQVYIRDKWNRPQYARKGNKKMPELVPQYGLVTLHFLTEQSYLDFCKLTPNFQDRIVKDFGDDKPVLELDEIVSIAKNNITIGTSGLEGLIGKAFEAGNLDIAEKIYAELKEKFKILFVELSPLSGRMKWFKPMFSRSGEILREGSFVENDPEDHVPGGDYQKSLNDFMLSMAEKYQDVVIPSLDFHFARDTQKLVQDAKLSKDGKSLLRFYNSNHIRSAEEIKLLFLQMGYSESLVDKWFENLSKWATLFENFKISTASDRWVLRKYEGDLFAELKKRIDRHGRMDWSDQQMVDRLKMEVGVLSNNGVINLLHYLFTVEDAANWCRENGLLMNVRGSAGGCLLMYLLGVSAFSPLKHGLQFERFLTEGRIKAGTLPDVDIDLSDQSRFVEEYLHKEYGDAVCRISTDMVLKLKSSIKDAERAFLKSVRDETEKLTKSLPMMPQGADEYEFVFGVDDKDGGHSPGLIDTNSDLKKYADANPEIWQTVAEMLGVMRNKSTHACGFVIADKPVQEYIPITYVNGSKVTAFGPKQIEAAGLIKFDFLGVNTLKDIEHCVRSIKERTNIDLNPFELPHDDRCYEAFAKGETETVFQFNTPTVIPYLKAIKPKNLDDLAAITALCRPGTLDAPFGDGRTLAQVFMARAQGEPTEYIHPDLEPILKETNGIQLYQEQTLQIFRDIAGYSFEEAETVRRGIGKKIQKVLESCMGDLKKAALGRGWTEEQVDLLIEQIMASSRYSFNKAHATAYAYNAYACMWLKTNYPLDWWRATLSNADKNETATVFWSYVKDFTELPAVNRSGNEYRIIGDKLVAPLSIVTGLGSKSFQALIDHSPYDNLEHFVDVHFGKGKGQERTAINTNTTIKLIAAGVLDPLFPDANLPIDEKIYLFNKTKAEVRKERSVDTVPDEYYNISDFKKYLARKALIKVYAEDLRSMVLPPIGGKKTEHGWFFQSNVLRYRDGIYYIDGLSYHSFKEEVEKGKFLPKEIYFGLVAYIMDEKTFTYRNKTKQATKIWIDVNGYVSEEVIWPDYEGDTAHYGFKNQVCLVIMRAREGSDGKNRIGIYDIKPILTKR